MQLQENSPSSDTKRTTWQDEIAKTSDEELVESFATTLLYFLQGKKQRIREEVRKQTTIANNGSVYKQLSDNDINQIVSLTNALRSLLNEQTKRKRIAQVAGRYEKLFERKEYRDELKTDDHSRISNELSKEEYAYLKSKSGYDEEDNMFYQELKKVETREDMEEYLDKKMKRESEFEIEIEIDKNLLEKWAQRLESSNYNDMSDIMAEWNWQQVSHWIQKMDDFSFMAGILAEFRINGIELTIISSKQMEILSGKSFYCRNMGITPDRIILDELGKKINQYRVGNVFKILYQQIWSRIAKKVTNNNNNNNMNIFRRMASRQVWNNNQNDHDHDGDDHDEHNENNKSTKNNKNSEKTEKNNDEDENENEKEKTSEELKNMKTQEVALYVVDKMGGIESESEDNHDHDHDIDVVSAATKCVEIVTKLRADRHLGMEQFWKEDGIFFDKIDNVLAMLTIPQSFEIHMMNYFENYLVDDDDDDDNDNDNDGGGGDGGGDDGCDTDIETDIDQDEDEKSKEMKKERKKTNKKEKRKKKKRSFDLKYLAIIYNEMNLKLKTKDYVYNYQKFADCVTGAEITSFIRQLSAFRTRDECLDIANIMLEKGWIRECHDRSVSKQTMSQRVRHFMMNKRDMNLFKDRGTAFYQLCGMDGSAITEAELAEKRARLESINVSRLGLFDSVKIVWKPVIVLGFGIVLGCLMLLAWWFSHSLWTVNKAMTLTVESVKQTANLQMQSAFGIPQTILQFTIGFLNTGDIPTDVSILDVEYDSVFTKFDSYDPYDAVNGVFIYNVDDNVMVGAFRDNNTLVAAKYYGENCSTITYVAEINETSTFVVGNESYVFNCSYIPQDRPWFQTALTAGNNSRLWTNVYTFANIAYNGISLVSNVYKDGKWFVIFVDYTTKGLEIILDDIAVPLDGVLYITTDSSYNYSYSVIASTDSSNKLQRESRTRLESKLSSNDNEAEVNTSFELKWNGNIATVSPIAMVWDSEIEQNGFLVIGYSDSYLDSIYSALWLSIGIGIIFCVITTMFAFLVAKATAKTNAEKKGILNVEDKDDSPNNKNGKNNDNNNNNSSNSENGEQEQSCWNLFRTFVKKMGKVIFKYLGRRENSGKCLIILCEISLCFTMGIVYLISYSATDTTFSGLINDIMVKEEYNQVQNLVMYYLTDNVDMTFGLLQNRMKRHDMVRTLDNNGNFSYDEFFINAMESLKDENLNYQQFGIYFALPNGEFHGMFIDDNSESGLSALILDSTTDWDLKTFEINSDMAREKEVSSNGEWKARCRGWYVDAVRYTCEGSVDQIFGNDRSTFNEFYAEISDTDATEECQAAKVEYDDMFGIYYDNKTKEYYGTKNVTKSYDAVWVRYILDNAGVGITPSQCVMDSAENGGKLLGITEIDYTLVELSDFLDDANDNNNSYSWVFEANENQSSMVASSDGQVLTSIEQDLVGLTCIGESSDSDIIAYEAVEHPEDDIRLLSQLVVEVNGLDNDSLPTNSSESKTIATPLNLPYVEAARVSYYPGIIDSSRNLGIDWVVVKSIDITDILFRNRDSKIVTAVITILLTAAILFLFNRLSKEISSASLSSKDGAHTYTYPRRTTMDVKDDWNGIICDSASVEWNDICNSKNDKYELITMNDAIKFSSSKAMYYISKIENEFFASDPMMLCDECCFTIENKKTTTTTTANSAIDMIITIVSSKVYNTYFVELFIVLHIFSAFMEPKTPDLLEKQGLGIGLTLFVFLCILIEWVDLCVLFFLRYERFRVRSGGTADNVEKCQKIELGLNSNVKLSIFRLFYQTDSDVLKVFIGAGKVQFNGLLITNILILFHFILSVFFRNGVFSYYIPIVPILLIFRHNSVYHAAKNCIFALSYATDALMLCFTMLIVCACFGVAIFENSLNSDGFANTYSQIGFSVITTFVCITTGENYDDLVNADLDDEYTPQWYKIYFFIIIMINLFCVIPALIERFEKAYSLINNARFQKQIDIKTNAIIASFIMLDIDGNEQLSKSEFENLFRWKDLTSFYIYLSKTRKSDLDLSLDDYIIAVLTNRLAFNVDNNIVLSNKWQGYIECKILRNPIYNWWFLLIGILPGGLAALLNGLANIPQSFLTVLFYWTFFINLIEILIKIWAFGNIGLNFRFFNLIKYEDPPFVQWCAFHNNMHVNKASSMISRISIMNRRSKTLSKLNFRPTSLESGSATVSVGVDSLGPDSPHETMSQQNTMRTIDENYSSTADINDNSNNHDNSNDENSSSNNNDNNNNQTPLYIPRALNYLTHEDWKWCDENLTDNYIADDTYTIWSRRRDMVANWFDFLVVFFSCCGVFYYVIIDANREVVTIWLQLPLLRLFTLIESNLEIGFELVTVANKSFAVVIIAVIYLFIWSRIGVALFYGSTDVVLEDIYDSNANVSFNSLLESILTLVQIMIGESWDEIMYVNVLATQSVNVVYFLIYVLILTLFMVHIVIGLILAGMNSVKKQMRQVAMEAENANYEMSRRNKIYHVKSKRHSYRASLKRSTTALKLEQYVTKNRLFAT